MMRGPLATLVVVSVLSLAACGGDPAVDPPGTDCGTAVTTAAGNEVSVFIIAGEVSCEQAVGVMDDYFRALERGEAPGMGGGGPVSVGDWTCVSGSRADPGTGCRTEDGRKIDTSVGG
ncbi:hypothetical protein SAMN04487905_10975 [Actinopolyspora xinjiangensis]|uniref:Lipoprotein n=1 Tax=Actinopolyspora xinjiangensis TaxID=405564 RepID=A0A1H0VML5_9ACTN|nr:hypothetical protein [Actinopolyspora xinjiangensis]SDP79445.1 hypothetical protein SAMN04487905_10975 [Actinopolyspora xinjiangensis]